MHNDIEKYCGLKFYHVYGVFSDLFLTILQRSFFQSLKISNNIRLL